jgi:hypothetical protein
MTGPIPGKKMFFGLALQSEQGTPVAGADIDMWMPVTGDPSLKATPQRETPGEYRYTMDERYAVITTGVNTEGGVNFTAYPSGGIEHALYGVFGNKAVAQQGETAAYLHTFTTSYQLPYFTGAKGHADLNMEMFEDIIFRSLQLDFKPKATIAVTTDMYGKYGGIGTVAATPVYGTERPFTAPGIQITLGGAVNTQCFDAMVKIDRGTVKQDTLTRSLESYFAAPITMNVTGSLNMLFEDYSDYEDFLGATGATTFLEDDLLINSAKALNINVQGQQIVEGTPDYYDNITLDIPKILFESYEIQSQIDNMMAANINFNAYYDTVSSKSASATVMSKLQAISTPV